MWLPITGVGVRSDDRRTVRSLVEPLYGRRSWRVEAPLIPYRSACARGTRKCGGNQGQMIASNVSSQFGRSTAGAFEFHPGAKERERGDEKSQNPCSHLK